MTNNTPIETLAQNLKNESELEITKVFFETGYSVSPKIDKAASLLLAGIGATAALIVGNLDKTSNVIGINNVRVVLWLLIIGGLFGLAQKYVAIQVQILLHVNDRLKRNLQPILDRHQKKEEEICETAQASGLAVNTAIDITYPLKEIEAIVPWYLLWNYRRQLGKSLQDPLHGSKRAARFINRQIFYAIVELFISIIVLVVVAAGI